MGVSLHQVPSRSGRHPKGVDLRLSENPIVSTAPNIFFNHRRHQPVADMSLCMNRLQEERYVR